MENAIKFAEWLFENMYDNTYKDVDGDGATWTNLDETLELYDKKIDVTRESENRYTIKELYKKYKDEK